ncbi:MAG TPA: protein kinase [Kofleriaceae bacterium]|nr:protein kinase [Kofleriaceae bacterium]
MAEDKRTKMGTGPVRAQSGGTPAPAPGAASPHAPTSYLPNPPSGPIDPLLGQTLAGRYQIVRKLGEGGMGSVYLAMHQVLEKQIALKVLHGEFARKPDLVERFMQEAKAASRIRHENVIDISDFGQTPDGLVFFAMELLHGHDLHDEIARARLSGMTLPWQRSKKIFLQICGALSAAHARGIVHRDLKPENVYLVDFLGDPDFVKLLDFGIAKLTELNEGERKLTKTGMLFGTPEYMSPEQARGEHVDHRVDIYAMGCILYQLVTGRVPFEADNFMGVLSLHLTESPPPIPDAVLDRIGAPRALAQVIERALAKDKHQRWQSIDELANAVRTVSGDAPVPPGGRGTGPVPSVPSVPTPVPASPTPAPGTRQKTKWTGNLPEAAEEPAKPRSKLPFVVGGVVVVAIAIVAIVLGTRGDKRTPQTGVPSGSAIGGVTPPAPPIDASVKVEPPPPMPALPDYAQVQIVTEPPGAEVKDLTTNQKLPGKTPLPLKLKGSHTPRQFLLTLRGHKDALVEVVPDQPTLVLKEKLQKGADGGVTVPRVGSGSSGPVTKPDAGSGSAAVKPPAEDCDDPPCIKTNIPGLRDGGT